MKKSTMNPVRKASGPAKTSAAKKAPAKTASKSAPNSAYPSSSDEKRWKTEDAMHTIMRAEELKKDRALMRDVKAMAREKAKKLNNLC